jgi:L-ascorbate metabolism protein UlaG (beta-lactamase superfamily)
MRVTKREHACLILEKAGSRIVVDPGGFTLPLTDVADVEAVVITHEHPDHWTPEQLGRLRERNSSVRFYGPAGVVAAVEDFDVTPVAPGDEIEEAGMTLRFFGGHHEVIHRSIPVVDNVGVLVDGSFYYGGDSYATPDVPVHTLAVPVGAPWLRIGDVMDYVLTVAPKHTFGVHDATLSKIGREFAYERIRWAAKENDGGFTALEAGQSLDL